MTVVWERSAEGVQSNLTAYLYDRFGEVAVRSAVEIDGRPLLSVNNLGRYSITILGALLSSRGRRLEQLLIQYVAYMRKRVTEADHRITEVDASDVEKDLQLSEKDATDLWNLALLYSPFFRAGGSRDSWRSGIPDDVHSVPKNKREIPDFVRRVVINWNPNAPTTMHDALKTTTATSSSSLSGAYTETADIVRLMALEPETGVSSSRPEAPSPANWIGRYRTFLRKEVSTINIFGDRKPRPLENVFIQLSILEGYKRPADPAEFLGMMDREMRRRRDLFAEEESSEGPDDEAEGGPRADKRTRSIKPDELLNRKDRIVISGAPGCGKTTLLKYLTMKLLSGHKLPVRLELKLITESDFNISGGSLPELLFAKAIGSNLHFQSDVERYAAHSEFFSLLAAGQVGILLDGLDEVSGTDHFTSLCGSIRALGNSEYGRNLLIISTRPYALAMADLDAHEMEIEALAPYQIQEFLAHYYPGDPKIRELSRELNRRRDLFSLSQTPFLLAVIAHVYRDEGAPTPDRLELYRKVIDHMVCTLDQEKQGVRRFLVRDREGSLKRELLKKLAFERLLVDPVASDRSRETAARLVFSKAVIWEKAKEYVLANPLSGVNFSDLALDIVATPLLRELGNDEYTFTHLAVQEYLAAEGLADLIRSAQSEGLRILARAYIDPSVVEMEILPMAIGLADSPAELFTAVANLPESITLAGLRLRARGLAYSGRVGEETLGKLTPELERFALGPSPEEQPLVGAVLRAFGRAKTDWLETLAEPIVRALRAENPRVRRRAAYALIQLQIDSAQSALAESLEDEVEEVRLSAAQALARLGCQIAIPLLKQAVLEGPGGNRRRAAVALSRIGSQEATIALVEDLGKEGLDDNGGAAEGLRRIGADEARPALAEGLRSACSYHRTRVAQALGYIGGRGAVELLVSALKHEDSSVRFYAARSLGQLGATGGLAALYSALVADSEQDVRGEAALAIGRIGGREAFFALVEALKDRRDLVRAKALESLGHMRVPFSATIVARALRDKSSEVRRSAAGALGEIDVEDTIPELVRTLDQDSCDEVRREAAEALGKIDSPGAVRGLLRALRRDSCGGVRSAAADSLARIGGEGAVRAVVSDGLLDRESEVRASAALALGNIGSQAVVPDLVRRALVDEERDVRHCAIDALGRTGGIEAVEGLRLILSEADEWDRPQVALALGNAGGEEAATALAAWLCRPDWETRGNAVYSLYKIGSAAAVATTQLARSLNDDPDNRGWAALALGRIGGAPAIVALIDALGDASGMVRESVARSLATLSASSSFGADLLATLESRPSEFVRSKVAGLLGYYAFDPLEPVSRLAALDSSQKVREAARTSLVKVKCKLAMLNEEHRETPMKHVFISYVREDAATINRLSSELESRGVKVWLDRHDILPGARWRDAIRKAIREGAFFLACFSKQYHGKNKTYMNEEITLAIEELRRRPTDRTWFLPVLLDDCHMPDRSIGGGETLADIQYVSLHSEWDDGVRKIVAVVGDGVEEDASAGGLTSKTLTAVVLPKPEFRVLDVTAFPDTVELDVNVFRRAKHQDETIFPIVAGFENIPTENGFSDTEPVWAQMTYRERGLSDMEIVRANVGCWIDEPLPDVAFPFRKQRFLLLGGWHLHGKNPLSNEFRVFEYSRELYRPLERNEKIAAPRKLLIDVVLTSTRDNLSSFEYRFEVPLYGPGGYSRNLLTPIKP